MSNSIINIAEAYVFNLFKNGNTEALLFHAYDHTYSVVQACSKLCDELSLSEEEAELLILAAHFHDVGYLESAENHEELSVNKASEFLKEQNYDSEKIKTISKIILATKMGYKPQNLFEEIIKDADTSHLGSSNYQERTVFLREECKKLKNHDSSDQEWLEMEIQFLTNHQYYTKHAILNWNPIKLKNIMAKKAELGKLAGKNVQASKKMKLKEDELKLKKRRSDIPEKGIETMFRTSLKNHMELSAIADNKANMMLSISALVISIVISSLASKLDTNPALIGPTVFMLVVCLVSIVLAALSTRPKITGGLFTQEDVKKRKSNLLFFGNFHKMKLDDYEWGMKEMMKDKEYLYSSLIRDLYSLGVVLARKYRYLRWCYLIFMYGMIISVLYFGVAMLTVPSVNSI